MKKDGRDPQFSHRSRHSLWALLASASVHVVALISLLLSSPPNQLTPLPTESVTVEVVPAPASSGSVKAVNKVKKKLELVQLLPEVPYWKVTDEPQVNEPVESMKKDYSPYESTGTFGTMNSIGLEQATAMLPYFESQWQRINKAIKYPEDFAKQRITGQVTVHLELDHTGAFTGRLLHLSGTHPLLKAYVAALLIHVLKNPIKKQYWLQQEGLLPVALSFDFQTYSNLEQQPSDRGSHLKNTLTFKREKYVQPIVNEKIEHLVTHYVPPILPIPGGFIIDFFRVYQMIQNIGEPTEEDLRQYRLKELRKELEQSVKELKRSA